MAEQAWTNVSIIDGALQLGGYGKDFAVEAECTALDTTPLATTGWVTLAPGLKTGRMSLEFMQDFDNGTVDDTLWAALGVDNVPRSVITNTADGSAAYLMRGATFSYTPLTGNIGEIAMGSRTAVASNSPLVRGKLLHPTSVARTSSSAGTARQLGAVAAGKTLYAALHVLAVSGTTPSLTVLVQSDNASGMASPTTAITFSAATAVGSQWGSVAGPITDDWFRVSWTISGTSPSFTFAVTCGYI